MCYLPGSFNLVYYCASSWAGVLVQWYQWLAYRIHISTRFVFSGMHGGTGMRFGICKQWDLLLHHLGQVQVTGLVLAMQLFKMGFVGRALYLRSWPSLASFGCGVPDDRVGTGLVAWWM